MYFYSSKAFEGEFYKSDEYVDATVIVSSDLYGQVEDYATKLENALIYFATNYTGSPAYIFGNVEEITGNLGINSRRMPETVPIALDLQIAFERQGDNPVILTVSDKDYADSFTNEGLAEHIKNLRDDVVENQYGVTDIANEFLPVQISAVVKETNENVPSIIKPLRINCCVGDTVRIYDPNDNLVGVVNTYYENHAWGVYELNIRESGYYKFVSTKAILNTANNEMYTVTEYLVKNNIEQSILVRPEAFMYWYGMRGPNFNIINDGIPNLYFYDDTHLLNVECRSNYTTGTGECKQGYFDRTDHYSNIHMVIGPSSGGTAYSVSLTVSFDNNTTSYTIDGPLTEVTEHTYPNINPGIPTFSFTTLTQSGTAPHFCIYAIWYD